MISLKPVVYNVLIYYSNSSFDVIVTWAHISEQAVDDALKEKQPTRALILSLRLNEDSFIKKCIFAVSPADLPAVAASIPCRYLQRLIEALADLLENCPHLEFILRWSQVFLLNIPAFSIIEPAAVEWS